MIERFLTELERLLPARVAARRRILAEIEQHLRESAANHGEREAVRRFGDPAQLAAELAQTDARRAQHRALAALVLSFVMPILTYPVVENSLPPAPWPAGLKPARLALEQDVVLALLVAGVCAVAVTAVAAKLAPNVAHALVVSGFLSVAMAGAGLLLSVEWSNAVPRTPGWLFCVPAAQLAVSAVAAATVVRAADARGATLL